MFFSLAEHVLRAEEVLKEFVDEIYFLVLTEFCFASWRPLYSS